MALSNEKIVAIEARISSRNYLEKALPDQLLDNIRAYIENESNLIGPFGNISNYSLILETEKQEKEQLGTYGVIQNAQSYIIGRSHNETEKLFDYAYTLENIVLYLTSLGIGTCWLGGRFKKQEAMARISLDENEIVPAITPIGYANESPHFKERMMRTVLKARKRKPEEQLFFYQDFNQPLGDRAVEFQLALHYLRIAPSAMNKQPWRLIFNSDFSEVHFYILSSLDKHPLYMCPPEYLDIGIAYNHFETGLKEKGIKGKLVIKEPNISKPADISYITTWQRDISS